MYLECTVLVTLGRCMPNEHKAAILRAVHRLLMWKTKVNTKARVISFIEPAREGLQT